jgi:uncharacterized protein
MSLREKLARLDGARLTSTPSPGEKPPGLTSSSDPLTAVLGTREWAGRAALRAHLARKAPGGPSEMPQREDRGSPPPGSTPHPASAPLARTTALVEPRGFEQSALPDLVRRFTSGHAHGRALLSDAGQTTPEHLSILGLDPALLQTSVGGALFLDTETTGLAGGTGTLPFLIGVGGLSADGSFWMEQLFLSRPGLERPLLARLRELLDQCSLLVTFNGKSFDWPLLRTRYVMNRLPPPPQRPHLDLLYTSRRVFGDRLPSHRLTEVERTILGFHRRGDISGAEVPERYFRFLRHGRTQEIAPILEHNVLDIAALAALLAHFARGLSAAGGTPEDALGLARLCARAESWPLAHRLAMHARSGTDTTAAGAHELLARLARRDGRHEDAAEALLLAASRAPDARRPHIHLELSKLYEHRLRDVAQAHRFALQSRAAEPGAAHGRRVLRLTRKLDLGRAEP